MRIALLDDGPDLPVAVFDVEQPRMVTIEQARKIVSANQSLLAAVRFDASGQLVSSDAGQLEPATATEPRPAATRPYVADALSRLYQDRGHLWIDLLDQTAGPLDSWDLVELAQLTRGGGRPGPAGPHGVGHPRCHVRRRAAEPAATHDGAGSPACRDGVADEVGPA
jgi:hypothetical protein